MTPLQKAKKSKTFCIYPWVHQYVGPPGDVKPCCVYNQDEEIGNLKNNTLEEIWNNDITKQMRLDMLEGREIPGCAHCNSRQDVLHTTHRDEANTNLFTEDSHAIVNLTEPDGYLPVHRLQYLDARWNNLCNLKCRTCGPRFSTTWIEDHNKLYDITDPEEKKRRGNIFLYSGKTQSQLFDEIKPHLQYVKRIYFAGGEPLMQEDHYKTLEELIRLGHTGHDRRPLYINYNTNFTQLKLGKWQAPELWKHFKNLTIFASLDGSHERAEYWRKGTHWETIENNRKRIAEVCPNVKFRISFTLSWPNAFNVFPFHKEWVEKEYIPPELFSIPLLDIPEYYSLKNIPTWKKKKIEEEFLRYIDWLKTQKNTQGNIRSVQGAISFMYQKDTGDEFLYKDLFLERHCKLDEIRNENFFKVFPEHNDIKEYLGV